MILVSKQSREVVLKNFGTDFRFVFSNQFYLYLKFVTTYNFFEKLYKIGKFRYRISVHRFFTKTSRDYLDTKIIFLRSMRLE